MTAKIIEFSGGLIDVKKKKNPKLLHLLLSPIIKTCSKSFSWNVFY